MSGGVIGAILGFLLGIADYGFLYKMVASARARNGGEVGPGLKVGLFITSAVAFTIVGWWVGTQLEVQGML